jgi:ATP-dependent helicase/nuclease subunit B
VVPPGPLVLLVPSRAAGMEIPRRLASGGRAVAGIYPLTLTDLARAIAEPALLGRGLQAWDAGHAALVATRLLEGRHGLKLAADVPLARVSVALARTLSELRGAEVDPARLEAAAASAAATPEDRDRLRALAELYRLFHDRIEDHFADHATLFRAARAHLREARWLEGAEVLVVDDLELDGVERALVAALAARFPVRLLARDRPAALRASGFAGWAPGHGIREAQWSETALAPLAPPPPPAALERVKARVFEPPSGRPEKDDSVLLLTAPGEAAEVRAVVRALLAEAARGVPFEDMGVILPRPQEYAPLFTDLLGRLGIPHRLHPSLPLRAGRTARSLLLLFRCRGLPRPEVMEFLTFAPIPFSEMLGEESTPRPAQWDALSRETGIVSGLERWMMGLRGQAEIERDQAAREAEPDRAERRRGRAGDAEALLRVVELLAGTLDALSGEASWPEWSARLRGVLDQWIGRERDRTAVADVIADLGGLAFLGARAPWREVERVLEARFEWERLPLDALATGAVHVGAMDALAGLPFRVVAIPGLVEGGYPGVLRPDPFLLDAERQALAAPPPGPVVAPAPPASAVRTRERRQLSLFDEDPPPVPLAAPTARVTAPLATAQDRLLAERRAFQRAIGQATERLVLSYPRADARTGRERMPSLFFVAAAAAREGRSLGVADLDALVVEDASGEAPLDLALDRSERDRRRVRAGGPDAALAIAAGSAFFRQSHLSARARWSSHLTAYDGLVAFAPRDGVTQERAAEIARKLDPVTAAWPISASRLAVFARCGFQYLLECVLRLEAVEEPEERRRLDPLERGSVFHEVAERFLRERRDRGELPLRDGAELRRRLDEIADEQLDALVATSPPRFTALWEKERTRFKAGMREWLRREVETSKGAVPAHFELAFGVSRDSAPGEPHLREPLSIDLGEGRTLRVSGKIDRIDRRPDGTLVLRDYKTGRAPRDDGGVFRGGRQLQIPFYILAAARIFPETPVVEAFLDYVDGGRQVAVDPATVRSDAFRSLLRGMTDAIAKGVFVQEPTACEWCDYKVVCGPTPLLQRRRQIKLGDERVKQVLRLRDVT